MSAASALGTNQQELIWAPQRSGGGAVWLDGRECFGHDHRSAPVAQLFHIHKVKCPNRTRLGHFGLEAWR